MSFTKETRNALSKMVSACRKALTLDVTEQLQGTYGLHPDGTSIPIEKLTHLTEDQVRKAKELRELQDHFAANEPERKDEKKKKAAYDRMVLEISFTILYRLAALKLCEERNYIIESVRKGMSSDGFQMFDRLSNGALGTRYLTYRIFIECMFDELAIDLGVLFDRKNPQSAIFPSESCLEKLFNLLNNPELEWVWKEDETIGWIYQYFNPPEERKAMREASRAPRNSRELAVRNQFFTPRYVVEFLTDNTLGRIWYEMRKGNTVLSEECRYLVRRPNEVFLNSDENSPEDYSDNEELTQEELLKKTVYIEHRPKKDPRDIKILDPACGSGHFLLYSFNILESIYVEAFDDPDSPKSEITGNNIQEDYESLDDLKKQIPELIIRHNLHGIDIDLRCVQIAALALWLQAQKYWQKHDIRTIDRPRITKSNIVCAEPMPGDREMLREFVADLKPKVLGQLIEVIFEKMELAGEAGPLLRIEEEIKEAITEAKNQWMAGPKAEQEILFPQQMKSKPTKQESRFDINSVTDAEFWIHVEENVLNSLKIFSEISVNGGKIRHVFADDMARGFAFIDLFQGKYDIVLMNPPYGDSSRLVKNYLQSKYDGQPNDLYGSFLERFITLSDYIGSLTSRTFLFFSSFSSLRTKYIFPIKQIVTTADLGFGVLDGALVETCAMVLKNQRKHILDSLFFRLNEIDGKRIDLLKLINIAFQGRTNESYFLICQSVFEAIEGAPVPYWIGQSIRNRLLSYNSLYPQFADLRQGVVTSDNFQFLRLRWEVDFHQINPKAKWASYAKGGDYSKYFGDIHLLIDWRGSGEHIKQTFRSAVRLRGQKQCLKPGLTYPRVTVKGMNIRILPKDCVCDNGSPSIFGSDKDDNLLLLGVLNSRLVELYIRCFTSSRHWQVGYVRKIPWPEKKIYSYKNHILKLTEEIIQIPREIYQSLEPNSNFMLPRLLMNIQDGESLVSFNKTAHETFNNLRAKFHKLESELDQLVKDCYEFTKEEWLTVEKEVPEIESSRDQFSSVSDNIINHVEDIISWIIGSSFSLWDIRLAIDHSLMPNKAGPFEPLPVCPPGMLIGPDGLPAKPNRIASEEWLRARPDANTLPPEGTVKNPTIKDSEYPIRISWDGILIDDPGFNGGQPHAEDIVRRAREVLDVIWGDKAQSIEQEACEILGVSELRDYFRKPSGFFQDHLKRYSKSRRQAPIYWPLSTSSGSYTVWVYYHRLTDQTIYTIVNKYLDPKISEVDLAVSRLNDELTGLSGKEATKVRDKLNEGSTFLNELREMRDELLRIAELPYKPNLNDGVIINAAPFHNLFRLSKWAKDTKKCWDKLEKGEYDWAHLAYTIWPDRVREVCKKDRSIAIAHDLESICEVRPAEKKKKRKSKKTRDNNLQLGDTE